MSNEVATMDLDGGFSRELAAQLGLTNQGDREFSTLSTVHINYDADDDDKRQLPVGQFKIVHRNTEGEAEVYYTRSIHFRPFMKMYQIRHWEPGKPGEKGKYANQTIMVPNWFTEMRDELGGVRCGKTKYKDWPGLTKEQQEAQRHIKASAMIYGTVSFLKGKKIVPVTFDNPDGLEDVDGMDEIPCSMRLTKGNMVVAGDLLESLTLRKIFSFARKFPISLEREQKPGAARPRYNMVWDSDNAAVYPLDETTVELIKSFQEEVSRINKEIEDKHDKAVRRVPTAEEEMVLASITGGATPAQVAKQAVLDHEDDPLAGDFSEDIFAEDMDDEIPF